MQLRDLISIAGLSNLDIQGAALDSLEIMGTEITGIEIDSRSVKPGTLFCGLPGSQVDGSRFALAAVEAGAVAVLVSQSAVLPEGLEKQAVIIRSPEPRRGTAQLAASLYRPQPSLNLAVTGTNGKTSVADFTRQMLAALGRKAVSVGTLGLQPDGIASLPPLTTPDVVSLHKALQVAALQDYDTLVIEASSHGLDQRRLDSLSFQAAAFTNISRDHLDYHADMEDYFQAKARLFSDLLAVDGVAVLNADIPEFSRLKSMADRHLSFGVKAQDIKLFEQHATPQGQHLEIAMAGQLLKLDLPLIGAFQATNVLASISLLYAAGISPEELQAAASNLKGVPGRMETVAVEDAPTNVLVDYAHTADALETVLKAARPHATGRLITVFGAGGDRDKGKRTLMGQAAFAYSDLAIVTDDNPRGEDPAQIRQEVLAGMGENAVEVGDRAEAIGYAIKQAGPNDLVVIAGKGHEQGQIVGAEVLPFSDVDVARQALEDSRKSSA